MRKKYLFIIAITLPLVLSKEIKNLTNILLPSIEIKIENTDKNNDILVLLEIDNDNMFSKENGVEFIPKGKYGYQNNALWIKEKEIARLRVKENPDYKLNFYNIGSNSARITYRKKIIELTLEKKRKNEVISIHLFKNNQIFLFFFLVIYFFLIILFYSLLLILRNRED